MLYVAATDHGGIAFLLADSDSEVEAVELPALGGRALFKVASRFERERMRFENGELQWQAWCEIVDATTDWLWRCGMGELVRILRERQIDQVLMIPVGGSLAQLPWHAAWREEGGNRHYACDDLIFRYAPNWPAGLIRCGAQQVVAPLWTVLDEATFDLMAEFYGTLGRNPSTDIAIALSNAVLKVRDKPSKSLGAAYRGLRKQEGEDSIEMPLPIAAWAAFALWGLPDSSSSTHRTRP